MKKIAIITAMNEEAEHIILLYWLTEIKKLQNITFYENENIILALAGIWKIQASIATTYILWNYDISKIINIWIAGSLLWDKSNIWDVFFVTKISQHDMYLPFDWEHLDYAKKEIFIENSIEIDVDEFLFWVKLNAYCLTWDQFIDNKKTVEELYWKYSADVIEMEAFAIASVAREYWVLEKCIFIKAISDWADNDAKDAHMGNLDFAMENSLQVLKKILSK